MYNKNIDLLYIRCIVELQHIQGQEGLPADFLSQIIIQTCRYWKNVMSTNWW